MKIEKKYILKGDVECPICKCWTFRYFHGDHIQDGYWECLKCGYRRPPSQFDFKINGVDV